MSHEKYGMLLQHDGAHAHSILTVHVILKERVLGPKIGCPCLTNISLAIILATK
jgi:hypothetical protein